MAEKVSIITISYNSGKAIERTFDSILKQSYRPLEYILVDGASTDNTVNIINKYIPRFESVGIEVKFKSEPDKGISDAFNKGVAQASGDIVGITNADDAIMPEMLNYIAENFPKDVDVFYGNCLWEDFDRGISYVRKSSADLHDLKIRLKILHPTAFIRRTAYDKYGLYDVNYRYCMDKDLLARMQRMGAKFLYSDTVFVNVSAGGVSDQNVKGVMAEGEKIAIANGVPPLKVKLIFTKNYLVNVTKGCIKKIPFVMNIMARTRRA